MKRENIIKFIIISLGVLLRLILSYVNEDYNDDHVTPTLLWIENGVHPDTFSCWECFQPPFYYWIIKLISSIFGLSEFYDILDIMQVVGFITSSLILYIIIRYIDKQELPQLFKYSLMLFWTLNPELISIGALNTNDGLVILLGSITYIVICRYFKRPTLKYELIILGLIFVMGVTKGNGLVYLFFFGVIWLVPAIKQFNLKRWLAMASMVIVTVILIAYVGQYHQKYKDFGDPFITNFPKQPFPNFYEPDNRYDGRKGVTSIVQTYGTFRLGSLLKEPFNRNGKEDYPLHRTSMLTQLYGQFSNYFFESHPHSWVSTNIDMKNFVRANYILHLPLFLLMVFSFFAAWKNIILRGLGPHNLAVIILTLFMLFLVKYSITYRDFSNMKLIFMFPAYLAFVSLSFSWHNFRISKKWLSGLMLVCCALYLINYVYLVLELAKVKLG